MHLIPKHGKYVACYLSFLQIVPVTLITTYNTQKRKIIENITSLTSSVLCVVMSLTTMPSHSEGSKTLAKAIKSFLTTLISLHSVDWVKQICSIKIKN